MEGTTFYFAPLTLPRFVPVSVFPIGIDPEKFLNELQLPAVQKNISSHKKTFEGKKVILAVDRLDYIKGIPHRLRAFELFLEQHPEWHKKVVLIQVAVPSRTDGKCGYSCNSPCSGRVQTSEIRSGWIGWKNQWAIWAPGLSANSLSVQERSLPRSVCFVCFQ